MRAYEARKHAANRRKRRHPHIGLRCQSCGNGHAMVLHRRGDMLVCGRCKYAPKAAR